MQDTGQEAALKRLRKDHQSSLVDLYHMLATQIGRQTEMQLQGQGMYLPSIQRFIKLATCAEKSRLKQLIESYNSNSTCSTTSAFYQEIWQIHMQRQVNAGEGVILLLIEPINNTLKEGDEATWAGLMTECLANKPLNFMQMLSRCIGFVPYLFHLAVENNIDVTQVRLSTMAMPDYFCRLRDITRGHINSPLSRFQCKDPHGALGAILKAMAFRFCSDSTKNLFGIKDTNDFSSSKGFFYHSKLMPYLTENEIIAEQQDLKPLPIELQLPEKKPVVKTIVLKPNFFQPTSAPQNIFQELDPSLLAEVMKITEAHPRLYIYQVAKSIHLYNQITQKDGESAYVRREIARLRTWNFVIKHTKAQQWRVLLSHAINLLLYGMPPPECKNTLFTFHADLSDLSIKQPSQYIENHLSQLYWIILNCNPQEQMSLELSTLSLIKFRQQFGSVIQNLCVLQDLWLLISGVTDRNELQCYLEQVLTKLDLAATPSDYQFG